MLGGTKGHYSLVKKKNSVITTLLYTDVFEKFENKNGCFVRSMYIVYGILCNKNIHPILILLKLTSK